MNMNQEALIYALKQMLKDNIISADFQVASLQGGTVGNVYLVTGTANTAEGMQLPYKLVLKIQKKWERYSDPLSWRREYDLYHSNLSATFSHILRWPACYHTQINDTADEIQLWLEYVEGVTGLDLTIQMYEHAAVELGRYQGRLYVEQHAALKSLTNLSHADLMKNTYLHYRSWPLVYHYIRSDDCEFPQHLRQMLIELDTHSDEIISRIEQLPLVLCHRDFWVTNLIYNDEKIVLIDWDTCGWGYLGEDIASLVADDTHINQMVQYYERCIPAYYKGFSEYADITAITDHCVYEMILLKFGYRLVEDYLHTEDVNMKAELIETLQQIYNMKFSNVVI